LADTSSVSSTSGLNNLVSDLLFVEVSSLLSVNLSGVVTDDFLNVGLVDGDSSTNESANARSDPGDEDELGSLALRVTSGETVETVLGFLVLEVGDELVPSSGSCGLNNNLVALSRITEDSPF